MFRNKVKWRSLLEQKEGLPQVEKIKRPSVLCSKLVEPEVKAWCGMLGQNVLRAVDVGARTESMFHTPKLDIWALRRLKVSPWILMNNDKEGAWSSTKRATWHLSWQTTITLRALTCKLMKSARGV